jgi:hypothetical protein
MKMLTHRSAKMLVLTHSSAKMQVHHGGLQPEKVELRAAPAISEVKLPAQGTSPQKPPVLVRCPRLHSVFGRNYSQLAVSGSASIRISLCISD